MKTIYYKSITIEVPESWDEITFENYVKATKNIDSELMFFANLIGLSAHTLQNNLSPSKVNELVGIMQFALTPPNPEPQVSFVSKGVVYSLHGSLPEMTFAQAIDIDALTNGKDGLECVTYILAVLYFASHETHYDNVMPNVMKRAKEFLQLPCTTVLGIHGFFLLLCHLSPENFLKFLRKAKEKVQQMETQAIAYSKTTDGEAYSMSLSAMTSLSSMKLEIENLLKY